MNTLNLISLAGIFGLCAFAWLFSENRRIFPWRVVVMGILLQLVLGAFVFVVPGTRDALQIFSDLLNVVFDAADAGARFVFGRNIVPVAGKPPDVNLGYIFAFRALPTVIFFSGLMALLYNIGVIQVITNVFAKVFYSVMRLSGAEALSGAANIFVGIEAAIVVKPYLPKMTRSELCAILACCFGTAASSTLAIYVSFLKPVFPNILGHLVSASIMAIPACFVLSKILVPETEIPVTAGGIPQEEKPRKRDKVDVSEEALPESQPGYPQTRLQMDEEDTVLSVPAPRPVPPPPPPNPALRTRIQEEDEDLKSEPELPPPPQETVAGEPIERVSPLDAAIIGALDGVKMAVSIAAVLILILGLVYLVNQIFSGLAGLQASENPVLQPIGQVFSVVNLQNIVGVLFLPLTAMTGVSLNWEELWQSSVIIGRRLFETAIPPYQALAAAAALPAAERVISDRAVLIVSYALSGFAHLASVGIFVGGTIALIPSRRKDISELGWKALFVGTLATMMIACVAGFYDMGDPGILGEQLAPAPTPTVSPTASPTPTLSPSPTVTPTAAPASPAASPPAPATSPSPVASPAPTVTPVPNASPKPASSPVKAAPQTAPRSKPSPKPAAQQKPSPSPSPTRSPSPR